jgi:hypothetical protein
VPPDFVLVWDLDRTLGVFDALEEPRHPAEAVTVQLRPGIARVLERLSAEGFVHTVLTLASPRYAEIALRGAGLRQHFAEVAGAGQRPKGDVEGIAHLLGVPPEERPHRMLFVGDHPLLDAPRCPDVVFHVEVHALARPARALCDLVLALRDEGEGSLRRGFDRLSGRGALLDGSNGRVQLRRVEHPGLDPLVLMTRKERCPVLCFAEDAAGPGAGDEVSFVPGAIGLA